MFEKFTPGARRVVVMARDQARAFGHDYIGTEHILLGLIQEGHGVAIQALETVDINPETVRQRVEEIIGHGEHTPTGDLAFTPSGKKALELSLRESLYLGHDYIGTEHLLLGLIREDDGVAAQVLATMGAELSRIRQQVTQLLHEYYAAATAPQQPNDPPGQEAGSTTQVSDAAQDVVSARKDARGRFGLFKPKRGRQLSVLPKEPDALPGMAGIASQLLARLKLSPTGQGSVCLLAPTNPTELEKYIFVRKLLSAELSHREGVAPLRETRDSYGFTWLILSHAPEDIEGLAAHLAVVSSCLADAGLGTQLLCSVAGFTDDTAHRAAIIYLHKRGTFYPFAPLDGQKRDNTLEIQVRNALENDFPIEPDLDRWFPIWNAPGLWP